MKVGVFRGYAINTGAGPEVEAASRRALGNRPAGFCSSDPRCRGHRHDEVAAGYLVKALGIESGKVGVGGYGGNPSPGVLANPDIWFCGASGSEDPRWGTSG